MKHWAGLHDVKDAEDIRVRVDGLLRLAGTTAITYGNHSMADRRRPLRLMDTERNEEGTRTVERDEQEDANA
jgi:hypothetical protein